MREKGRLPMDSATHSPAQDAFVKGNPAATIVLVTNQFQCERIIRAGRVIANISKTELMVFNVENPEFEPNPQAIEFLYQVSLENGAVMNVSYADNPEKAIISFIKNNRAQNVLTGMPRSQNSLLHRVWKKFSHIRFFVVDENGTAQEVTDKQIYATV